VAPHAVRLQNGDDIACVVGHRGRLLGGESAGGDNRGADYEGGKGQGSPPDPLAAASTPVIHTVTKHPSRLSA